MATPAERPRANNGPRLYTGPVTPAMLRPPRRPNPNIHIPTPSINLPNTPNVTARMGDAVPPQGPGFTNARPGEVWPHYPQTNFIDKTLPWAAVGAQAAYSGFRAWTVTQVPAASLPIAGALFLAEVGHAIGIHGIAYQFDVMNLPKYAAEKERNWASQEQIEYTLSQFGDRTLVEVASGPESAYTVLQTVFGVLEMEGNKQVIWNSQAGKPETFAYKRRLVEEVNKEYKAVWDFIVSAVGGMGAGAHESVRPEEWNVNEKERNERAGLERGWANLDLTAKRYAMRRIYGMLGRRFLTRGGLFIRSGSPVEGIPSVAVLTEMLRRVHTGELRDLGETEESGLWREVDISQYGYARNGQFVSYEQDLPMLAKKIWESMHMVGRDAQDQSLFDFSYLRELIDGNKAEELAAAEAEARKKNDPSILADPYAYFPKNVRKGGEDIKIGLEYEARAEESLTLDEATLNAEFNHLANTYSNHEVIWWDRDRLSDQDHGGRKANSMNSLILHVGGRWLKVVPEGADVNNVRTSGRLIAADAYSALMRIFIEKLENGQQVWDEIAPTLANLKSPAITMAQVGAIVSQIETIIRERNIEAKRWVVISDILRKLEERATQAGTEITDAIFNQVLANEDLISANVHPTARKIRRYAKLLARAKQPEERRKILRRFFDSVTPQRRWLAEKLLGPETPQMNFEPNTEYLTKMCEEAIRDTIIPEGHRVLEEYDLSNIKFFANVDAEVNPRPEFLEQMIPYFNNMIAAAVERGELGPLVLQSPQFYTVDPLRSDKIHLAAHLEQRPFYKIIQPSKSYHKASFSCGSNVVYLFPKMRRIADLEYSDPTHTRPDEPGGLSQRLTSPELMRDQGRRPIITFLPPNTPVEDFAFSLLAALKDIKEVVRRRINAIRNSAKKRYYTIFQDLILCKGEAPKDVGNWLGAQHPKWGATVSDFFYRIVPAMIRWMPGSVSTARALLMLFDAPGVYQTLNMCERGLLLAEKKSNDWKAVIDQRIKNPNIAKPTLMESVVETAKDDLGTLYRNGVFRPLWYSKKLIEEVSFGTAPKLNPFTVSAFEFFRAGSWFLRGWRDMILMLSPGAYAGASMVSESNVVTDAFTPMTTNIGTTLMFLTPSFATSAASYLWSMNRHGMGPIDVIKKDAVVLTQGWPGYVFADMWSLESPSGRPGATTSKAARGNDPLPMLYEVPAIGITAFNAVTGAAAGACVYRGYSDLGFDLYNKIGGGGMAAVGFWSAFHAGLGILGRNIGKGGPVHTGDAVTKRLVRRGYDLTHYYGEDIVGLQNIP